MLSIQLINDEVIVTYKSKIIMTFPTSKSIKLGIGIDSYIMKHGAFKFKEKAIFLNYDFYELDEKVNTITFNNLNHKCTMRFRLVEHHVEVKCDYTDKRINRVYLNLCTSSDEIPYGCGEQFASLSLKNKKVKIWVSEHIPVSNLIKKAIAYKLNKVVNLLDFNKYASYMVQPTFVTNKKLFFHLDVHSYSHFEFMQDVISFEVREALESFYIGIHDTYEEMMNELTSIVGKQSKLPDWIFDGMILGIQDGTKVCNDKAYKMKSLGACINGIWAQDWEGQRITAFGKQLFWDWKFDQLLYADLPQYIEKWEEDNIKFLGYINPFLAIEGDLYKEASEKGYVIKNSKGKDYLVKITTFPAAMIDLTNPAAYKFMKDVVKENMIGIGLKGWMADFAEYLPTDSVLFSGEDPRLVHNTWPVRWAKLNEEAIAECGLQDEILFFVRAGYTGTSKHAKVMWNGDQHVDWSRDFGIGSIVNSQLSLGLSGIGNSHSDIGGYTTFGEMKRSKELLLRWTEMNAFSMIMRSHEGNQPDKNHQFDTDDETINHVVRFTKIYSHMKPYLKSVDEENSTKGMPSIRPLFFYYKDKEFLVNDQVYLLGRDLLVCPVVTKGQISMDLLLPQDTWIHAFTGEVFDNKEAKHLTIECGIGMPVVFYRSNSAFSKLFSQIREI